MLNRTARFGQTALYSEGLLKLATWTRPATWIFGVCLLSGVVAHSAGERPLGAVPPASLGATDIYREFRLPPLKIRSDPAFAVQVRPLRVMKRAAVLDLTAATAIEAWQRAENLLPATAVGAPDHAAAIDFAGNSAADLNRLLSMPGAAVKVTAAHLNLDEPIRIAQRGTYLDFGSAQITASGPIAYMLRIEGAGEVTIHGGDFTGGDSGILVNGSDRVRIIDVHLHGLRGTGIVVTHSTSVMVRNNRVDDLEGAGVLLAGGTSLSVVQNNQIVHNRGSSNMNAGIVVSDREADLPERAEALLGPDGYWAISQPLEERLNPPHDNLIESNHLAWSASSGVYVDGGVATVIASNVMEGNAKEGICLDNGATANVVALNKLSQNGSRWGESDAILAKDSIQSGGRLPDGTPAEKVPGISLDNAAYNVIFANTVTHNFGGGIKMVRTAYLNAIGLNTIWSNNDGASARFHFFGIELGSAALDVPSEELDGAPSRGNIVFSNTIRGNHYSGIFFAPGSDKNDVFDNVIMDAQKWALESVSQMPNSTLNNLTNLPSRNVSSGLSPALVGR